MTTTETESNSSSYPGVLPAAQSGGMEQLIVSQADQIPDVQLNIIENLDHERFNRLYGLLKDRALYTDPFGKKTVLVVGGLSASGKTGFSAQFFQRWDQDDEVRDMVRHHNNQRFGTYYLNIGQGIRVARDAGIVTSPPGKMRKKEYEETSDAMTTLMMLGIYYLPNPAIMIFDSVLTTGIVDEKGGVKGIDRGLSTAQFLTAQNGALNMILATDEEFAMSRLQVRERVISASPREVHDILQGEGIIDTRPPEEIQQSYRNSGNTEFRFQQDSHINRTMLWSARRRGIDTFNGEPLRRPSDFNQNPEERYHFMVEEYLPEWFRAMYQTTNADERTFIFPNNPLAEDVFVAGEHLDKSSLVSALVNRAKETGNQHLRTELERLKISIP